MSKNAKIIATSLLLMASALCFGLAFGNLAQSMAAIFSLLAIISAIREGHE